MQVPHNQKTVLSGPSKREVLRNERVGMSLELDEAPVFHISKHLNVMSGTNSASLSPKQMMSGSNSKMKLKGRTSHYKND